jgi:hypothetical protein
MVRSLVGERQAQENASNSREILGKYSCRFSPPASTCGVYAASDISQQRFPPHCDMLQVGDAVANRPKDGSNVPDYVET